MGTRQKQQEIEAEKALYEKVLAKFNDVWMDKLIDRISIKIENNFKERMQAQEEKIILLEKEVQDLKTQIVEIRDEKDNMEQFSRKNNIRIFGINETNKENTNELVINLIQNKLNITIDPGEIDMCYRVGTNTEEKVRPILVKFKSNEVRNEIFYKKKTLKGTRITIREDLTKNRVKLVKIAVEKFGAKNVWTNGGKIIIHHANKKNIIRNIENILSLN